MNIENKKQIAILILAILLGLIAALLTGKYIETSISKRTEELARDYQKNQLQPILQQMSKLEREVNNISKEQIVLREISAQQKLQVQAAPGAPWGSLPLKTPPGKRAVTIRIDSLAAVGGLLNPGDYVDILAHLNVPKSEESKEIDRVITMLFQNVKILAVGSNLQPAGSYDQQMRADALNITLALDPEQVGYISFAQLQGRLQLALRSPAETEMRLLNLSNWKTLSEYILEQNGVNIMPSSQQVQEDKGEEVQEPEEEKPSIQIFHGGREL